jgi:hypothetical protein
LKHLLELIDWLRVFVECLQCKYSKCCSRLMLNSEGVVRKVWTPHKNFDSSSHWGSKLLGGAQTLLNFGGTPVCRGTRVGHHWFKVLLFCFWNMKKIQKYHITQIKTHKKSIRSTVATYIWTTTKKFHSKKFKNKFQGLLLLILNVKIRHWNIITYGFKFHLHGCDIITFPKLDVMK